MECCTISQNIHWPGLEISETARVKLEFFLLSDHVSSGSDLNAPLGQLLEPISSSETRDVKPGLERKSSNLAISEIAPWPVVDSQEDSEGVAAVKIVDLYFTSWS